MISEEIITTIKAMCRQEQQGYTCSDYLQQYNKSAKGSEKKIAVDHEVRTKLVEWCYSIVDFCKFNRETVAIATSCLDRFLLSELGLVTLQEPTIYQLAAMTSLYMSIKVHEPEAMDPELVSNLSHGAYTIEQVEAMEYAILQAIDWRVNTPTSLAFLRHYLDLMPSKVLDKATKSAAYDLCLNQTEVAVKDYKFVTVRASVVAFVCLMNSLESLCIDSKTYDYVSRYVAKVIAIDGSSKQVSDMQTYLYPYCSDNLGSFDEMSTSSVHGSKSSTKRLDRRAAYFGMSPCSTFDTFSPRS